MTQALGLIGGIGGTIAGGVNQVAGINQEYDAKAQTYRYQAGVADINAKIATQNASFALDQGESTALNEGMKLGAQFGNITAAQASSGIDINSGSAVDVRDSQRKLNTIDIGNIQRTAAKTAYDYGTQSTQFQNQATLDLAAADNTEVAKGYAVKGSIIGTSNSVASKWLQGSQLGMFGTGNNQSSPVPYTASGTDSIGTGIY
jgi:hypothetical protein